MDATGITSLEQENERLRQRVTQLEREVAFLRTHPVMAQGIRGESLVASAINGTLTSYAASHDVITESGCKVEVKFSKLNCPNRDRGAKMLRWNWSKPLGWKDKGKDFDFLLLVGEKDWRYADQYPDDAPYVFFLIPRSNVPGITTRGAAIGGNVQINTNLSQALSAASRLLKGHLLSFNALVVILQGKASA